MKITIEFDTADLAAEAHLDPAATEAYLTGNHDAFVAAARDWARQYLAGQGLPAGPGPEQVSSPAGGAPRVPTEPAPTPPAPEAETGSQIVGPGQ